MLHCKHEMLQENNHLLKYRTTLYNTYSKEVHRKSMLSFREQIIHIGPGQVVI